MRVILLLLLAIFGFQANGQSLTLEFTSEEDQIGNIYVQILNRSEETVLEFIHPYDQSPLAIELTELSEGTYAIRAFHDLNGNGELDASWFGLPTEPYGFSNNARGRFGPPELSDQLFELKGQCLQKIHLQ